MIVLLRLLKNTIILVYNIKRVLMTKMLTVKEKTIIFKTAYSRLINDQYYKMRNIYNCLNYDLLDKYFIIYDKQLNLLKDIEL